MHEALNNYRVAWNYDASYEPSRLNIERATSSDRHIGRILLLTTRGFATGASRAGRSDRNGRHRHVPECLVSLHMDQSGTSEEIDCLTIHSMFRACTCTRLFDWDHKGKHQSAILVVEPKK